MDITKLKTMSQVADELGLTHARISQLCSQAGISGISVGSAKLLSPADIKKIKSIPRRTYRKAT